MLLKCRQFFKMQVKEMVAMNTNTVLIIDSSSDLPLEYVEKNNLPYLGLSVHYNGNTYTDDFGKTLKYREFYNAVRNGALPTTSQINVYSFVEEFKKYVKMGKSIIYIGFSSALSGCVNNAKIAKELVLKDYKNADITIIDTKSACIGEGLLVYQCCEMLKNDASKDEIINWLNENKLKVDHWFVVDNLYHLKRGGRISGAAAVIGSLFQIKPILNINDDGGLVNVMNAKGKKQALRMLIDKFTEKAENPEDQIVGISHGDCMEDALLLKSMLLERFKIKKVIINHVGPVIGSHVGPGMVSLCFFVKERDKYSKA